ncbi:uncharacterized protein F5891DRAFT_1183159 [Suillus fuscotomentosus]|uniref:DUF6533 domain-containing protein n=1 Tax=Suillus fuscotomentosus TaxID=1912939 RepID=A0AAD4HQF8_9AGAM|nr:uncharacterized protein F5891DRAFT_1183159 [Suillus fuscotomentosus]KAG1905218.1 hypothetical protein F5891DRAFT_1183159 [Suillus fuscotomentosus]
MLSATNWMIVIAAAMLDAIMVARLYAMYHGSRKMLIFLVVIFLAVNISCGVMAAIILKHTFGGKIYLLDWKMGLIGQIPEEAILSGTYACSYDVEGNYQLLSVVTWIITAAWEVLALCLALWITAKQLRDLRRLETSIGSTIGDCLTMLIKSHLLYFAGFLAVACLELGRNSSQISDLTTMETQIYEGFLQFFLNVQMFVLGPRLILSVREYNAKLVNDSDTSTHMTSVAFQELRAYLVVGGATIQIELCFAVSTFAAVVYDYVLTLGKEIELIWKQRWSLMTILYLSIRYVGLLNAVYDIYPEHIISLGLRCGVSEILYEHVG